MQDKIIIDDTFYGGTWEETNEWFLRTRGIPFHTFTEEEERIMDEWLEKHRPIAEEKARQREARERENK